MLERPPARHPHRRTTTGGRSRCDRTDRAGRSRGRASRAAARPRGTRSEGGRGEADPDAMEPVEGDDLGAALPEPRPASTCCRACMLMTLSDQEVSPAEVLLSSAKAAPLRARVPEEPDREA